MRKRGFILVCSLIVLASFFTVCYFCNAYRRAYDDYQYDTSNGFSDIYFVNAEDGWLLSTFRFIFITNNGGISWERHDAPSFSLTQVQFVSKQLGWLLGNGEIYKSTDGGLTWTLQTADMEQVSNFYFVNETTGWAVSWTDTVLLTLFITHDGGTHWQPQLVFPYFEGSARYIEDLYFINETHGWFLYQFYGVPLWYSYNVIYSTNNSGVSWTPSANINTSFFSLNRIYFTDPFNGWAIGGRGALFTTNDSGHTWENQSMPLTISLENIYFLNNSIGWICGENSTLLHTCNGGDTWISSSNSSLPIDFSDIFFQNTTNGWAVGSTFTPYISSTGGEFWQTYQLTVFSFDNSWIWALISLNLVFLVVGTWSIYNWDRIRRTRTIRAFKTALNKIEASLFNTQTISRKILATLVILCLFYVLSLFAILIHELGHAVSSVLLGGYTEKIEINLNTSGLTYVRNLSPFTPFADFLNHSSGLLTALIIGIILLILLRQIRSKKKIFTLLTVIIAFSFIIEELIYFIFTPLVNKNSDAFMLASFFHIPTYVISLLLLPAFIISTFFILKFLRNFYTTSIPPQTTFLYLLLFSFSLFFCIYSFVFSHTGPLATLVLS